MKHNIFYYSDCQFFAGCENMIGNFLNDQFIQNNFCIGFVYSFSEKYERGLNSRVPGTNYQKYPLRLMKQVSYVKPLNPKILWSITHKLISGIYILFYKYLSILVNTFIIFSFFRKHKVEILHINNGGFPAANSCYSAVIAAKMTGIRVIIYVVNNMAEDYLKPLRWFDYPIDFFIKKWVTLFITGSEYAGERLKKVLGLDEGKHITINNGIRRREITLSKQEFKKKYLIPENKIIISTVANLELRKGHIFLLEAIFYIKENYPKNNIPLFIIEGDGPEKGTLIKYIAENDLKEYIWMIDYIPDIFNLLNASDFVILPSIGNEDFPNVIIEAMSLGKPVIGTEIAGIPEQIDHNKSGIVVKPKSSMELVHAIMNLTLNPALVQKFSTEAINRYESLFEVSISIKKYYDLYRTLL